jgi:triosephosphate isomerase
VTRTIKPLVAGNWKMNGLKADLAIAAAVAKGADAGLRQRRRPRDLPACDAAVHAERHR